MKCFALLALTLASCATIMTGSTDSVMVLSNPLGAQFTTNSGHEGTTPSSITIPDDLDLEVHYSLDGYADQQTILKSRMSGWLVGDIFLGGFIGLVVDLVSGNYMTHAASVTATLQPIEAPEG